MDDVHELEQMRARVAHLEALVEILAAVQPQAPTERAAADVTAGLSRRRMLRNGLGLSAAAVAGVGLLDAVGSPAAAADGDAVKVGQTVSPTSAASDPTRITNPSPTVHAPALFQVDNKTDGDTSGLAGYAAAILGTYSGQDLSPDGAPYGAGVLGLSENASGVIGWSENGEGVRGTSYFGTALTGTSDGGTALLAETSTGTAVEATSTSGNGIVVTADAGYAVKATSAWDDASIYGIAHNGIGVLGTSDNGWGMAAQGKTGLKADGTEVGVDATCATGTAVKATATSGAALDATSTSGVGVRGTSTSATGVAGTGSTGVHAIGEAIGVDATGAIAVQATTEDGTGISTAATTGVALRAASTGASPTVQTTNGSLGTALQATSEHGLGAALRGGSAPLRLMPTSTKGHPKTGSHHRGEFVVDRSGRVWVCTKAGTPGTWKRLAWA